MKHIAILSRKWQMLEKIESGEKTIESRWYKSRFKPWDSIQAGEIVYFKETGKDVCLQARIARVEQIDNITPSTVRQTLNLHQKDLGIDKSDIELYYQHFKDKKYCILIYLAEPKPINPFKLNKAGIGMMSAWICFRKLTDIKMKS